MKRVITFGTFDLLHEGHLRILKRARELGDYLVVGVSSDRLNADKGKRSFFSQDHRLACVKALKWVDEAFIEDSLELKDHYIREHAADLLVMGDDWRGKFDWVSCPVEYLPRTEGVSTTDVKIDITQRLKPFRAVFADTYVDKHYECALSLVNRMAASSVVPLLTFRKRLPEGLECDCLVYFNLPANPPPDEYLDKPRILVDHGASHLKWFLANSKRYEFFDVIITAGPDHSRSLRVFFPGCPNHAAKIRSAGFIKSDQLLASPTLSREKLAQLCGVRADRPIVLFVPTWHISNNKDMALAIRKLAHLDNHVAILHPETVNLDVAGLNVARNENGILSEALKHADIVVSDLSSTIFEAAALNKSVVQLRLREYSDNNATMFDFPYTAGSAELFCGGIPAFPDELPQVIRRLLASDPTLERALAAMRKRVLAGTIISNLAAAAIVEEIKRACDAPSLTASSRGNQIEADLAEANENLRLARSRLIAHAAGDYQGCHASNSREALAAALKTVDLVEIDLVMGADDVLVAHDGFEGRYGFRTPFREVDSDTFARSKFDGRLTPLDLRHALEACNRAGKGLVCDIKGVGEEYVRVARRIRDLATEVGVFSRVIVQCYEVEDFNVALREGFRRTLLAVWKHHYRDPLGDRAFDFVQSCIDTDKRAVVGISIPYTNKHMRDPAIDDSRFMAWYSFWKRIYIHGAPLGQYERVLNAGLGLFADRISGAHEFKDAEPRFSWREYLFLNPDVADAGHANPIGAHQHYLRYGRKEGRQARYQVPGDFRAPQYIDLNPDLRKAGISGVDGAKSHWTRHGAHEGRRYKP